jgi:hypothetical protein
MSSIQRLHYESQPGPIVITVPREQVWKLLFAHVHLTTSATGGNRWMRAGVEDENNHVMMESHAGAKQVGSLVRHYMFLPNITGDTAFNDDEIKMGFPQSLIIQPGEKLYIGDSAGIDTANDLYEVHISVEISTRAGFQRQGYRL